MLLRLPLLTSLVHTGKIYMQKTERFRLLDGMRGVAAVAVVVGHSYIVFTGTAINPNISLAVPFFFMLSAFVLCHAYRKGLDQPGAVLRFAQQRIFRLFPLILLSGVFGSLVLGYHFSRGDFPSARISHVLTSQLLSLTTLPTPFVTIDDRRWPVNPPEWSLFFELVASAALGLWLLTARKRTHVSICLIGLVICAVFAYIKGTISTGLTAQLGITMVSFPLGCVLYQMYREKSVPSLNYPALGFLLMTVIMAYPVLIPYQVKLLLLVTVFPLIIWLCLDTQPTGLVSRAMDYIGDISYPIYILHWPVLLLMQDFIAPLAPVSMALLALVISWVLAHVALVTYDIPVRRFLAKRYLSRGAVSAST